MKTKKIKVYIGGSADEINYRKEVHNKYKDYFRLLDPLKETPRDLSQKFIVEMDKLLILECDILVAYIKKFSCGTIMEILFAYIHNIPIYIITQDEKFMDDIWLSYHTDIFFKSIEKCFDFLKEGDPYAPHSLRNS